MACTVVQFPELEEWQEELSIPDEPLDRKGAAENVEDYWMDPEEELDFTWGRKV